MRNEIEFHPMKPRNDINHGYATREASGNDVMEIKTETKNAQKYLEAMKSFKGLKP